jgi:putative membrane protein
MRIRNRRLQPYKGLFIGAISGLAGTILMTQFQNIWNKLFEETQDPKPKGKAKHAESEKKEQTEDSTSKAAGKISKEIGHPLSRKERKKAGPWVHYAFGTSVGAIFGFATETEPDSVRAINPWLAGAAYGAAVFFAAHEVAVPALKLSSNPLKEPISEQIAEFVSHLIYGVGTALTYDGLNRLQR